MERLLWMENNDDTLKLERRRSEKNKNKNWLECWRESHDEVPVHDVIRVIFDVWVRGQDPILFFFFANYSLRKKKTHFLSLILTNPRVPQGWTHAHPFDEWTNEITQPQLPSEHK